MSHAVPEDGFQHLTSNIYIQLTKSRSHSGPPDPSIPLTRRFLSSRRYETVLSGENKSIVGTRYLLCKLFPIDIDAIVLGKRTVETEAEGDGPFAVDLLPWTMVLCIRRARCQLLSHH